MDSVRRPFGRRGAENALRYLGATAGAVSRRCYRGAALWQRGRGWGAQEGQRPEPVGGRNGGRLVEPGVGAYLGGGGREAAARKPGAVFSGHRAKPLVSTFRPTRWTARFAEFVDTVPTTHRVHLEGFR